MLKATPAMNYTKEEIKIVPKDSIMAKPRLERVCPAPWSGGLRVCIRTILTSLLLFLSLTLFAQARRAVSEAESYFAALQTNRNAMLNREVLEVERAYPELLDLAIRYSNDSTEWIRYKAYSLANDIGLRADETGIRQQSVEILSSGSSDKAPAVSRYCNSQLTQFKREDFSAEAIRNIKRTLESAAIPSSTLIKVAGYIKDESLLSVIQTIANQSGELQTRFTCYLALTRMEQEGNAEKVLGMIRNAPVNDDFIYEVVPDLVYTRNKQVIDKVVEILHSSKKDCFSSNADNEKPIVCGYRVMEYLAPVIEDFPLAVSASGDIETNDYKEALNITREWFRQHASDYQIKDITY